MILAIKEPPQSAGTVQVAQNQAKVLVLGANALVRDNVRVLLGSMGHRCLVASTLKEAFLLLEQEITRAAILDPQQEGSSPAEVVAGFHRMFPSLRGRTIVLTSERADPELFSVIDAYSLPHVPAELFLQKLWPMLDSLLSRRIETRSLLRRAQLVFDSFLQPSPVGIRSSLASGHRLLYESADLMVDLSLEPQGDLQRIALVGQVVDPVHLDHQLDKVPVVVQGQAGLIGVATTNKFGEFSFEFDSVPGITLEIGVKGDQPLLIELSDLKGAIREATDESQLPETAGEFKAQKDLIPKKSKRR